MSKVIDFPLEKRLNQIKQQNYQKLADEHELSQEMTIIDNTAEYLMETILVELSESGYDMFGIGEKYIYETSFVYESMRSLLMSMSDEEHPLQNFAETMYNSHDFIDNDDENMRQLELDFQGD
jgi:hypothetical protein